MDPDLTPADDVPGDVTPRASEPMLVLGGVSPGGVMPPAAAGGSASTLPCADCPEGQYDTDGYCANCGAKERDPRDHVEAHPASWVAGVCDRGIRHASNEDALAVSAGEVVPHRASLVVCDGVSTAQRSAQSSQAAADAALSVLDASRSRGIGGVPSAVGAAMGNRLDVAADAAADAVREVTEQLADSVGDGFHVSNPACTFVAAVIDGDTAVVGSVGDSRAYWVPDVGDARRLTTDDSWAEEQVKLGAPRADAEVGPQAHTITRWIGVDTPDHVPAKATLTLIEAGWLVLCSDGLWNYCSEPDALAEVVRGALAGIAGADEPAGGAVQPGVGHVQDSTAGAGVPLLLARELVGWANARGGRDNITVALARIDPARHRASDDPATGGIDG